MKRLLIAACLIALTLPSLSANDQRARVLLQAAEAKAKVEGDLNAAIKLYKDAEKEAGANRALVAQALVKMADAYRSLGNNEARKIYERLVRDYSDQEAAVIARAQLAVAGTTPQSARRMVPIWTGEGVGYGRPSLDGRYIAFQAGTGDLAIRDVVASTTRLLTNTGGWIASGDFVRDPVVSPDSRFVAYTWFIEAEGMSEVRVLPLQGNAPVRTLIRTDERYPVPLAWTSDGTGLLVLRTTRGLSQLGTVTTSDGRYQTIKSLQWTEPISGVSVSPDGRYVAYQPPAAESKSKRDIVIRRVDGSGETAALAGPEDDFNPMWSPDSAQLVFMRADTGGISLWAVAIQEGKPVGSASLIRSDLGRMNPLGITRNGSLYYALSGAQRHDIYVAQLDNSVATKSELVGSQIFDGRTGPAWTPDGELLTYWAATPQPAITVRSLKSGQERTITLPTGTITNIASPKWFPDGRSLLLPIRFDGNRIMLSRFHIESGNLEQLVRGAPSFAVAPDGGALYWVGESTGGTAPGQPLGRLMRLDLKTREEQELQRDKWFLAIAISPDGKELAYLRNDRTDRSRNEAPGYLEVIPSGGGEPRQVFRDPIWYGPSRNNTLAWSPDQQHLLAVRDDGVLWRFPVNGDAPQSMGISALMYQFANRQSQPRPPGDRRVKSPAIHPDGRTVAFAVAEIQDREIWSLENFLSPSVAKK